MATTIKEFIEYLKTLPPDTEVGVICGYTSGYSYDTKEVPLEIDEIPVTQISPEIQM